MQWAWCGVYQSIGEVHCRTRDACDGGALAVGCGAPLRGAKLNYVYVVHGWYLFCCKVLLLIARLRPFPLLLILFGVLAPSFWLFNIVALLCCHSSEKCGGHI
jgi:hypothetical protein